MIEDKPGERLRWRATEESPVSYAGSVSFTAAVGNRGTIVTVGTHYREPGGAVGNSLARFLGADPFGEITEDLRRFKQLIETGEIATTSGQPSGRRSLLGSLLREGRKSRQPRSKGPRSPSSEPSDARPPYTDEPTPEAPTLREERLS
jgi:hypothetical protein